MANFLLLYKITHIGFTLWPTATQSFKNPINTTAADQSNGPLAKVRAMFYFLFEWDILTPASFPALLCLKNALGG